MQLKKCIYKWLNLLGFYPSVFFRNIIGLPWYISDFIKLKLQIIKSNNNDFDFNFFPMLNDKHDQSGIMSGHYFHQDLYVAKMVFKYNPIRHVDVGSRTDGFVAHVASFREVELLDIRDQKSTISNIKFRKCDLMNLPVDLINYCDSISSLHAIEHFGLGRYGDPINFFGHINAIKNITTILKPGGRFYFSVPIGMQRIEFNAHRVFSLQYLIDIFRDLYNIDGFSFIDDNGDFFERIELTNNLITTNCNCFYGCGIFELIKK